MRQIRLAISVAAVWGVAIAATLFVSGATTLGPVVLEITKNHGIHLGDVLVAFTTFGVAAVLTALVVGVSIGEHLAARRVAVGLPAAHTLTGP